MSDQTTETSTEVSEQDQPATEAPAEVPASETDAEQGGNREAAKWRRQLRDVEAERDGLRERVTSYERTEVERLAAGKLADPSDLWTAGVELDSLRDKSGAIDPAKVAAAAGKVLEEHPHWKRQPRTVTPVGNLRSGASSGEQRSASWADAFASARGR
ncbi:hypothetical protein [Nocardia farcinica]|uniref:hypothetical protein n=1 Tax=Nocardia farcinica TaxID=37329 RepID=UPI0024574F37|nr:hypothetical protein [Nocardia farcinica]